MPSISPLGLARIGVFADEHAALQSPDGARPLVDEERGAFARARTPAARVPTIARAGCALSSESDLRLVVLQPPSAVLAAEALAAAAAAEEVDGSSGDVSLTASGTSSNARIGDERRERAGEARGWWSSSPTISKACAE